MECDVVYILVLSAIFETVNCLSCEDPGYPAGGEMKATSFADGSVVTFRCLREGFTLTHTDSLVCLGTSWNGTVPQCVDTQPPTLSLSNGQPCDGSYTIVVKKYESISLPTAVYSDNVGIASFTIYPPSANTTLKVEHGLAVTYSVTDYAGLQTICRVSVELEDETPPTIICPAQSDLTVYLHDKDDTATLEITDDMFTVNDNLPIGNLQPISISERPPTTYGFADLYKTFTFVATVRDENNNSASCRAQVFVGAGECTDLSFPSTLNAEKNCDLIGDRFECVIFCHDSYTFGHDGGEGKRRTMSCTNGSWDTEWIPACVKDVTPPRIRCPESETIFLSTDTDSVYINFARLNYSVSDLNYIKSANFSPFGGYTFTNNDLYRALDITLTVIDGADLQSTCRFQYLVLPQICSPLSHPVPLYGSKECYRNNQDTGYRCILRCHEGYMLPDHGWLTTVVCTDGGDWNQVIPACEPDTVSPIVTCPSSRTLYMAEKNELIQVDFASSDLFSDLDVSDNVGVVNFTFDPASYMFTANNLYTMIEVTLTAGDHNNNTGSCRFYVRVLPATCSTMILPVHFDGQNTCFRVLNGWTCDLKCENGYGFTHTTANTTTFTCSDGDVWTNNVPGCASLSDIQPATERESYYGELIYQYQPTNRAGFIGEHCRNHYLGQQRRDQSNGTLYEAMATRMANSCFEKADIPSPSVGITITFIHNVFLLSFVNVSEEDPKFTRVFIWYAFIMNSSYENINACKEWLASNMNSVPNEFEFSAQIVPGDNASCPDLEWENVMDFPEGTYLTNGTSPSCSGNYFISPLDSSVCRPCPWGSVSDSRNCQLCPIGQYHDSPSSQQCTYCASGYTTRSLGEKYQYKCVYICQPGQYSDDGLGPCFLCPIGSYNMEYKQTACVSCPPGLTTATEGSSSNTDCMIIETGSQKGTPETCGSGTELSGGTCVLCPKGTYRSASESEFCLGCPQGTTNLIRGAVYIDTCTEKLCIGGFVSSDGRPPCTECPVGTYFVNSTYCQSCPNGTSTVYTGASHLNECLLETSLRVHCPAGTFRNGSSCTTCPVGTYAPEASMSCTLCPENLSTFHAGATSILMCHPMCPLGFASDSGMPPCEPCGKGYFSLQYYRNTCVSCPLGMTTMTTTAEECISECQAGTFSATGYHHPDNRCRSCPANYYQDLSGQTMCIECLSDEYTPIGSSGLTRSGDCYSGFEGLCFSGRCLNGGSCEIRDHDFYCDCREGYYGRTCSSQVDYCESGPCYNNGVCTNTVTGPVCDCNEIATGSRCEEIIKTCNPGYCKNGGYCRNLPGGSNCLCVGGFSGNTCSDCLCRNGGSCRTANEGQILEQICDCPDGFSGEYCEQITGCHPGSYSDQTDNMWICRLCERGTYQPEIAQSQCLLCPNNFTTRYAGSFTVNHCHPQCQPGTELIYGEYTCQQCAIGWYNDLSGENHDLCKFCPDGYITTTPGKAGCPVPSDDPSPDTYFVTVVIPLVYLVETDCSVTSLDIVQNSIENTIQTGLNSWRDRYLWLCGVDQSSCNRITAVLGQCTELRKRSVTHNLHVTVTLPNVTNTVIDVLDSNNVVETGNLIGALLESNFQDFSPAIGTVEYGRIKGSPIVTPVCNVGYVFQINECVPCQVGQYWTSETKVCSDCPVDTFQDEEAQTACTDCPEGHYSDDTGATSASTCKSICDTFLSNCNNHGTCSPSGRRSAVCVCDEGYSGVSCVAQETPMVNVPAIVGGAVGGVIGLVAIIIVVVCVIRRFRRRQFKSKAASASSPDQGDNRSGDSGSYAEDFSSSRPTPEAYDTYASIGSVYSEIGPSDVDDYLRPVKTENIRSSQRGSEDSKYYLNPTFQGTDSVKYYSHRDTADIELYQGSFADSQYVRRAHGQDSTEPKVQAIYASLASRQSRDGHEYNRMQTPDNYTNLRPKQSRHEHTYDISRM